MRPLNRLETESIVRALASLVGAQLQECAQADDELGLGFYHRGRIEWLWFDFDARAPFVGRFEGKPPARKKSPKPLSLFIRAHLVGRRLSSVECEREVGRVITFHFFAGPPPDPKAEPPAFEFEARLFPGGQNAIARAAGKSVSLRPATPLHERTAPPANADGAPAQRSWGEMQAQWLAERSGAGPGPAQGTSPPSLDGQTPASSQRASPEVRAWERALEKKARALEKMRADLAAKESSDWARVGEWLKAFGRVGEPPDWPEPEAWAACLEPARGLAWNIQTCFAKAKENARKIDGARARLAQVEREIARLRAAGAPGSKSGIFEAAGNGTAAASGGARAKSLLERAEARGRRLAIADDLEAFVGRSAKDNLAILRRAAPHDLWLHLRDYPGAHAIVRRAKNRSVGDRELAQAARWLAEESLKKNARALAGQAFDVIVAEARHVRPIKGDKLGRVNYANERVLRVRFED